MAWYLAQNQIPSHICSCCAIPQIKTFFMETWSVTLSFTLVYANLISFKTYICFIHLFCLMKMAIYISAFSYANISIKPMGFQYGHICLIFDIMNLIITITPNYLNVLNMQYSWYVCSDECVYDGMYSYHYHLYISIGMFVISTADPFRFWSLWKCFYLIISSSNWK